MSRGMPVLRGGHAHTVATFSLGTIQRGIGACQDLLPLLRRVVHRHPSGKCHGLPLETHLLADMGADALYRHKGTVGIATRKPNDEFFSPKPIQPIGLAQDRLYCAGPGNENGIALFVSIAIVDRLEMVEIDDRERAR